MDRDEQFQELRPLLFSLAYRMLGTRADAEDIVQEAYLRWHAARDEEVRAPKSYLTTVVARLALDSLKAAYRKRETYPGTVAPRTAGGAHRHRHRWRWRIRSRWRFYICSRRSRPPSEWHFCCARRSMPDTTKSPAHSRHRRPTAANW